MSDSFTYIRPLSCFQSTAFGDISPFDYEPYGVRRSTIIGTLADPKITEVDIQKMMEVGMNGVRFLTGHSTAGDKIRLLAKIDKASKLLAKKYGLQEWPCATCVELKTSAVTTGLLENDRPHVIMKKDTEVILTHDIAEFDKCNETRIFVDNKYIVADVKIGMEISIRQDSVILKVTEILENTVKCTVIKEGILQNMDCFCMCGASRNRPYITKKDLEITKFAVEYQVDVMIVNYSRHPETLRQIKKYIGTNVRKPFMISGICTYEGLCNIDEIIQEADGILLSRGLLAYELDREMFYRMAQIQKMVIGKCRQAGKPCYVSGQIFEKTITYGELQHEDVSDISNAILEGASGFIMGSFNDADALKVAIKELASVCEEMEQFSYSKVDFERNILATNLPMNAATATAISSVLLANQSLSSVIIIPTVSGRTIYYLNYMRPLCMIIAITTNIKTFRLLQVFRSVNPLFYTGETHHSWRRMMKARVMFALDYAVDKGYLNYGDLYITLEKGCEESSYCDTVKCCKVVTKKSLKMRCEDE